VLSPYRWMLSGFRRGPCTAAINEAISGSFLIQFPYFAELSSGAHCVTRWLIQAAFHDKHPVSGMKFIGIGRPISRAAG
jgi:hypothetical protein